MFVSPFKHLVKSQCTSMESGDGFTDTQGVATCSVARKSMQMRRSAFTVFVKGTSPARGNP